MSETWKIVLIDDEEDIRDVMALSLLDAALTLYLVSHGASEVNPVMNYFLQKGPTAFMAAKYLFTCMAVVIFVVLANNVLPWPGKLAP